LDGNFTLVAIPAGSVATRSRIAPASASTLPAKLPVGMLAVSIAVDNVKGVAGFITPGDRVDVIAVPPAGNTETPRGYAIIRDALVLAVGDVVQAAGALPPGVLATNTPTLTTVTLALTPPQVDIVEGADVSSTLRLALRNPNETTHAFPAEALQLTTQGASVAANPAPIALPPIPSLSNLPDNIVGHATSAASAPSVSVIDGDRVGATAGK
jgi:pilus assembly protein CpaB